MHIGFRAGNAAELVLQSSALFDEAVAEPSLVVNVVENDVDLITIVEKRIAAVRSFRLPAEQQQKNLADEIERTLTIGLEESEHVPIRRIILFGDGSERELANYLSQSDLAILFLNPFALPNVSVSKSISNPEKFAPLIGSLLIQSQNAKPVIDFLHPKEAPKPPNYARPALLALVLLGIIGVGLYFWNQSVIGKMKADLAQIKEEHQKVANEITQLTPSYIVLWQTQNWEYQNVVWLDVLKDLSEVLPSDTDLVVANMTLTTGGSNNPRIAGSIVLSGMVRDTSVLMKLQNDLQSTGRYWVQYQTPSLNPAGGGYPWTFRTLTIYRLR
jgi:hypothetical protein